MCEPSRAQMHTVGRCVVVSLIEYGMLCMWMLQCVGKDPVEMNNAPSLVDGALESSIVSESAQVLRFGPVLPSVRQR